VTLLPALHKPSIRCFFS